MTAPAKPSTSGPPRPGDETGALRFAGLPGWSAAGGWLVVLVVALALNGVAFALVTRPLWLRYGERAGRDSSVEEAVSVLEPALERARREYGPVVSAEAELDELRRRVRASTPGLAAVVASLQAAVDGAGTSFQRIQYDRAVVDELGLLQLHAGVPVSGPYGALRRLLTRILDDPSFLVLEGVGITASATRGAGRRLQADLSVSAFFDPETASASGRPVTATAVPADGGGGEGRREAAGEGGGEEGREAASDDADGDVDRDDDGDGSPTAAPGDAVDAVDAGEILRIARDLTGRLDRLPPLPLPPSDFDVHLEKLDGPAPERLPVERNLFAFPARPAELDFTAVAPEEAAEGEPDLGVELLGILRVGADRYVTLRDGRDTYVVAAGARLPGGIEVVAVGADFVELRRGDRTARLELEETS